MGASYIMLKSSLLLVLLCRIETETIRQIAVCLRIYFIQ